MSDDSRGQPDHQCGDDHHGPVVDRPPVVPGGDPAPLFEPVHAPLYHVASPVGIRIEARLANRAPRTLLSLVASLGDRVRDAAFSQSPPVGKSLRLELVVGGCLSIRHDAERGSSRKLRGIEGTEEGRD